MANISITLACEGRCPYCFALPDSAAHRVSIEGFAAALDLVAGSGQEEARILGGEPTTHPLLPAFLDMARERGLRALVFTNGLVGEGLLEDLSGRDPEDVRYLLNATAILDPEASRRAIAERAARALGAAVTLGFTIASPEPRLERLLDLVDQLGTRRAIRLGLAFPSASGDNEWLRPKHYEAVGRRVASFARAAASRGVGIELDCGFVPCMFGSSPEDLPGLSSDLLGRACGPIPDILPDGRAIACYPLAGLTEVAASDVGDLASIRAEMAERTAKYDSVGIFPECRSCPLKARGECLGGCLAVRLSRLRRVGPAPARTSASAPRPEADRAPRRGESSASAGPRWAIPYIDAPSSFWAGLFASRGGKIGHVYLPLPGLDALSGRPPQSETHLDEFLGSRIFGVGLLVNPILLRAPLESVAPSIFAAIERVGEMADIAEITVSSLRLAKLLKRRYPGIELAASTLMDIFKPSQLLELDGAFETIVPSGRVMRDRRSLEALRKAFRGRIRLLVNEACLPDCPHRVQHFYEMSSGLPRPASLCEEELAARPWRSLTGAWVLPQHLDLYDGLYDELKLSGRSTLGEPSRYLEVLGAYLEGKPLSPSEIGGGPASPPPGLEASREFFERTLRCDRDCRLCRFCERYYTSHTKK